MGTITVKVGSIPGVLSDIALNAGATVRDALAAAGLNASGYDVRLNGTTITDLNTTLSNGALVLLAKQIKGN